VKKDLKTARRSVTFSLVTQLLLAILAYIFIITEAFPNAGILTTATQMSASGLWAWMVPVCWGWVFVGTQYTKGTIVQALKCESNPIRKSKDDGNFTTETYQDGIRAGGGLNAPRRRRIGGSDEQQTMPMVNGHNHGHQTASLHAENLVTGTEGVSSNGLKTNPPDVINGSTGRSLRQNESRDLILAPVSSTTTELIYEQRTPYWYGIYIAGDEGKEGPIFNYARFMTCWQVAETIRQSFETTRRNLQNRRPVGKAHSWTESSEENLSGTKSQMASYCDLSHDRPGFHDTAYPEFHKIDPCVWGRLLKAAAVAIILQWGTTGPSILIAFLTPTVGLGCRSGSYLLYGCLATMS
jgi:hypothetical protein